MTQMKGKTMPQYNGHKNWNFWNVALWLANDEPLYRMVVECKRRCKNKKVAAKLIKERLPAQTPDGAPYSLSAIEAAITGL